MKIRYFIIVLMFFLFINLVSSAPAIKSVTITGGLEIIQPIFSYHKQGEGFNFDWHVSNESALKTNLTTDCTFHLYSKNEDEEHIYIKKNVTFNISTGRDFEVYVIGANFTNSGDYCYLIECRSVGQVGSVESCFEVNPLGIEKATTSQSVIILSCLLIIALIGIFFLILFFKIEHLGLRTVFMGIAVIDMIILILFSLVLITQIVWDNQVIIDGATTFWFVGKIILGIALTSFFLFALYLSFKIWEHKRGYKR